MYALEDSWIHLKQCYELNIIDLINLLVTVQVVFCIVKMLVILRTNNGRVLWYKRTLVVI